MKLLQLRLFCEVVENGFNVSRAAAALHTSQPGVSRHLRLLEASLGVVLLNRQKTRITGLTREGSLLLPSIRQMLTDADNLGRQAREVAVPGQAKFAIATTHTHARYTLLPVLKAFMDMHPGVTVLLRQGSVPRISQLVRDEVVDIGVSTDPLDHDGLSLVPCYRYAYSLITPRDHPLARERHVKLEQLAAFPLITYDERHRLGRVVREKFAARRLEPNIVMSIIDDDIMKSYVEAGFGLAIMATLAFDPNRDRRLGAVSLKHLFDASTCYVVTKQRRYLERPIRDFIGLVKTARPPASTHAPRAPAIY